MSRRAPDPSLFPLPPFQFRDDVAHERLCLGFRHDPFLRHNADALIDHTLHAYIRLCECAVLKAVMAVIIDPQSIGCGSKVLRFLKGHTAALAKWAFGLLTHYNTPPFVGPNDKDQPTVLVVDRICLLACVFYYSCIVVVGAYPNPDEVFIILDGKRPIVKPYPSGPKLTDLLEMKGWM